MPWTEDSLNPADDPTESNWLREAKTALRARDPVGACVQVDAADDAETLARWADRHCRDILRASRAAEQKLFNSGYWDDD